MCTYSDIVHVYMMMYTCHMCNSVNTEGVCVCVCVCVCVQFSEQWTLCAEAGEYQASGTCHKPREDSLCGDELPWPLWGAGSTSARGTCYLQQVQQLHHWANWWPGLSWSHTGKYNKLCITSTNYYVDIDNWWPCLCWSCAGKDNKLLLVVAQVEMILINYSY